MTCHDKVIDIIDLQKGGIILNISLPEEPEYRLPKCDDDWLAECDGNG